MSTLLLKDRPECAERIENNYSLIGEIEQIFHNNAEVENDCETVSNPEVLAELTLKVISEFVNANYTWKGVQK